MKRIIIVFTIIFFAVLSCACGESTFTATVNLNGSHKIEGGEFLKTGKHTFVLTALENAPMPEGSVNGVKKVTISSGEDFEFGEIRFNKIGTFEYIISRETLKSDNLLEDDRTYSVSVTVLSNGTALTIYSEKGVPGKPDSIEYVDKYIEEPIGTFRTGSKEKVRTGDAHVTELYMALFLISATALVILNTKKKDKKGIIDN